MSKPQASLAPWIALAREALRTVAGRRNRLFVGAAYGAGFYVVVNSLALPLAFGDPTPWQLGVETVYPSLAVHLVYGLVLARLARFQKIHPRHVQVRRSGRRK